MRVPLALLAESRRSDSLAEFFSDLAGSLFAGYLSPTGNIVNPLYTAEPPFPETLNRTTQYYSLPIDDKLGHNIAKAVVEPQAAGEWFCRKL